MSKQVGIDIGTTAVRLAEVSGISGDSLAQVTKVFVVPLPPGAVVAGRVKDPYQVAFALREALKGAKVSSYGLVIGMSSPDAAIARISMPMTVKPQEWAQVIRLQERAISPRIPISESALSLRPIAGEESEGKQTLLAAAVLRSEVDLVAQACSLAKITPRAIDLAGAATVRCMTRAVAGNDDVATIVDIGASKVTVATRQGLHLRTVRTIEGGGEDITRAIGGATNWNFDEAERRKRAMRLGDSNQPKSTQKIAEQLYGLLEESRVNREQGTTDDLASEALNAAAETLVDAIARAVESDTDRFPLAPTQGLIICGGGGLLQGVKERLQERVGVPAVLGRPWAQMVPGRGTNQSFGMDEAALMISMSTAVGLAMWKES